MVATLMVKMLRMMAMVVVTVVLLFIFYVFSTDNLDESHLRGKKILQALLGTADERFILLLQGDTLVLWKAHHEPSSHGQVLSERLARASFL